MQKPSLLLLAGLLAVVLLAGCGKIGQDKETAAAAMDKFHERFNAGDSDKIYDLASADFQKTTPRSEFLKFLDGVHRNLGDYERCESKGWNKSIFNSDTTLTLHYHTTFTKGAGDEEFVYQVSGARATLRGYHIHSNQLVPE